MLQRVLIAAWALGIGVAVFPPGAHSAPADRLLLRDAVLAGFQVATPALDHGFGPIAQAEAPADTLTLDSGSHGSMDTVTPDSANVLDATVVYPEEHHRKRFKDLKPGEDFVHGMRSVGSDAWAVVRGPASMDGEDALLTLAALGVAGTLYAYDREVLEGMHRSWDAPAYGTVTDFGTRFEKLGFIGALAPYYAAGFAVTYALRLDPFPRMFAEAAESNLIAGVLRNVLEMSLRRARPREDSDPRTFFVKRGDSFPSGHASVAFELATVAAHHTPSLPLRILYYAVASSVSIARAQDDAHWPSDVFVGACIGTVVARTIVRRHDR